MVAALAVSLPAAASSLEDLEVWAGGSLVSALVVVVVMAAPGVELEAVSLQPAASSLEDLWVWVGGSFISALVVVVVYPALVAALAVPPPPPPSSSSQYLGV